MIESEKSTSLLDDLKSDRLSIINNCFQCGFCTSICPLRRVSKYNPRGIIHSALLGHELNIDDLTTCLTCGQCFEGCPQEIDFPNFIRENRASIIIADDNFAHHNIFNILQLFMTQMTESGLKYEFEGEFDSESDVAYFPGCVDLFDHFLDLKETNFHQIGQSAINLINKAGIKPNLISLKCCGHDAYWTGDNKPFEKLREYNSQMIKDSGIKTLIVSCAECYYTFGKIYELKKQGVNVKHISQFIEEHQEAFIFKGEKISLTYHDACRLGRFMKEYRSPRTVLKNLGPLIELTNNRENSTCCGVSAWLKCDDKSRAIMLHKLEEAVNAVGNEGTLAVGCTKCFAHLNCVLEDKRPQHDFQIKVKEIGMIIDEYTNKE